MRAPAPALLLLAYLAFVSLGLPDAVLGVAWPSLRATFDLSQAALGGVLAAGVSGYFVSGLVAGRLVTRLGVGGLLASSSLLVALGLAGNALAPAFGVFVASGAVIGLGSGAIDAALNGYAAHHLPVRHLNWLHAFWGVGATIGPLLMTGAIASGRGHRAGYGLIALILAGMAVAFLASRRRWDEPGAPPRGAAAAEPGAAPPTREAPLAAAPTTAWSVLRRGRTWLQVALFFCYTGLEASAGAWCFSVLRDGRGLSVEAAGTLTALYWGSLTAGRFGLGFVVDRVGPDRLLRFATFGALAGASLFALGGGVASSLGLGLLGLSLAPLYPTLMARTPARLGRDATAHAVGFQVSAATLGSAVLPSAAGLLVTRAGLGAVGAWVVLLAAALLGLHEALLRASRAGRAWPASAALPPTAE